MINIRTNEATKLANKQILSALKAIKSNKEYRYRSTGICDSVRRYLEGHSDNYFTVWDSHTIYELMREWPKHSGNNEFPITVRGINPMKEYLGCYDKWDRKTEYGRLRWELLEWLINKLESENDHQNAK